MIGIFPFEIAFTHLMQENSNYFLDLFFFGITQLGNPALWVAVSAFFYWNSDERKSFYLMGAVLLSSVFVALLKPLIARPRPDNEIARIIFPETGYGFPSGHSTIISSVYFFYEKKLKKLEKILGILIVLLVMISRIYLGNHFLLDVITGLILGFIIGKIVFFAEEKLRGKSLESSRLLEETGLIAAITLMVVVLVLQQHPLAGAMLGYFAGIFAFKFLGMDSSANSMELVILKQITGFTFLGMIYFLSLNQPEFVKSIIYFIAGIFISFIYPAAFEKIKAKTGS